MSLNHSRYTPVIEFTSYFVVLKLNHRYYLLFKVLQPQIKMFREIEDIQNYDQINFLEIGMRLRKSSGVLSVGRYDWCGEKDLQNVITRKLND